MKGLAVLVSKGGSWRRTFVLFFKTTNNIHMNCKNYHRKIYTMDKYCELQEKLSKTFKET